MAKKESQTITKNDVGTFDPGQTKEIALLKPPTSLTAPTLSEAEQAFMNAAEGENEVNTKLPFITIDHKSCSFILPSGETIDGQDGVQGFIIAHFTNRAYYEKAYMPGGDKVPPDCKSADCITPAADSPKMQSRDCMSCKHNVFGSAPVGKGKACKERIWLFLVNPEFQNPPVAIIVLPPSSISKFYGGQMKRGYIDHLKAKTPAWRIVWTKITLQRLKDEDIHCVPDFEMGDMASMEVAKALAAISNQLINPIKKARLEESPLAVVAKETE